MPYAYEAPLVKPEVLTRIAHTVVRDRVRMLVERSLSESAGDPPPMPQWATIRERAVTVAGRVARNLSHVRVEATKDHFNMAIRVRTVLLFADAEPWHHIYHFNERVLYQTGLPNPDIVRMALDQALYSLPDEFLIGLMLKYQP